ncbi:MAG: S49 family peptidase [Actinomycetia bacterium]|nr:S49 family peptidase [Actinomycetes bacterium]
MGAALGVGAVLLAVSLLSVLALVGMTALAGSGQQQASSVPTRVLWGPTTAKGTLYAIQVTGTIQASASEGLTLTGGTNGYEVADLIDQLKPSDAGGLLLLMNTPGGTINGSRAIAEAANRYRERTGQKVYAYVEGTSASGGVYAMASADRITADHGTMIGSIGVVSGPFARYKDVTATSGTLLTSGVTTTGGITYEYLTQGTGKDFGSPYRDMTPEEKAIWVNGLANEYEQFVDWVAQGRKIPAETIKTQLGAHLYDARTAKENKLIDEMMGRSQAFADAAQLAGLDPKSTKVITPTNPSAAGSREEGVRAGAGRPAGQRAVPGGHQRDLHRGSRGSGVPRQPPDHLRLIPRRPVAPDEVMTSSIESPKT